MFGDETSEIANVRAPSATCNSNNDNYLDVNLESNSDNPWRSRKPGCTFVRQPTQAFVMDDVLQRLQKALAGRYTVERLIGRGGMSLVYLAQDLRIPRKVAMKVLRPELTESRGTRRFLREIEIAAKLEHPHILPLFDKGEADGLLFFTMPYVEGESLRDRIKREGPLPLDDALQVAKEVAEALSNAHDHGVVHRDIKPENILLTGGIARVADFGIAKARTEAGEFESVTDANMAVGTPEYMSPEQAGGSDTLDGRTDIYSLGCVLYEMLAGEPPFTGRTLQAIIAKHLGEKVPTLTVVRPGIPVKIVRIIEKALAKVPAVRHATARKFVEALEKAERQPPKWHAALSAFAATVILILAVVRPWGNPGGSSGGQRALDSNKVVVFPLVSTNQELIEAGLGWSVSLAIGGALEHAQPLKFLDVWRWLSEAMRANPQLITPDVEERISRERGARYYTTGVIRPGTDSVAISLQLLDVRGDSLIAQETASGALGASAEQVLGIEAISLLLPRLVEPGRDVDLSPYTDRDPGAILLSIQGDRHYRHSRFAEAYDFYSRAVEEDSLLAFAAVKGAQAASWLNRYDDARELTQVAVSGDYLLPTKYREFVHGWSAFLDGNADSAVATLKSVLAMDRDWSEAAMALGEVYYHLLPSEAPLDSLAEAAFEDALAYDSAFVPALFHLGEIAVRGGELARAESMIHRIEAAEPDSTWLRHLNTMMLCARSDGEGFDWQDAAEDALGVLNAARSLAVGGAHTTCAQRGFETLLRNAGGSRGNRWGALMGLQGVLLAQGRYDEALDLLDSAQAAGSRGVFSLYILDALAGAPFDHKAEEAEEVARRFAGEYYSTAQLATRWLLGTWNAHIGQFNTVEGVIRELQGEEDAQVRRIAGYLEAHAAAVRGNDDAALAWLQPLITNRPAGSLNWDITGPLAPERILLAELLLARHEYEQAERVASVFDHQGAVVFLPFLPRSLMVRLRAARALGLRSSVRQFSDRLEGLGWADSVAVVVNR